MLPGPCVQGIARTVRRDAQTIGRHPEALHPVPLSRRSALRMASRAGAEKAKYPSVESRGIDGFGGYFAHRSAMGAGPFHPKELRARRALRGTGSVYAG